MHNFSPLRYPGGKNKTYDYIRYLVRSNNIKTYIEPFCGGAAVAVKLLINNDVERIIINDYDRSIYAVWYSILNMPEEFIEKIDTVELSVEEWQKQQKIQRDKDKAELFELGFSTFYLNRTNRSGIINAGPIGGKKQNGLYKIDCRFNSEDLKNKIKLISTYKNRIKLYNVDAVELIKKSIVRTRKSLTFFDPPYFVKGKELYTNFYELEDHILLGDTIKKYMNKQKWILTYDIHDEILDIYSEFEHFEYTLNYSIGNHRKGREFIFLSDTLSSAKIQEYLKIDIGN